MMKRQSVVYPPDAIRVNLEKKVAELAVGVVGDDIEHRKRPETLVGALKQRALIGGPVFVDENLGGSNTVWTFDESCRRDDFDTHCLRNFERQYLAGRQCLMVKIVQRLCAERWFVHDELAIVVACEEGAVRSIGKNSYDLNNLAMCGRVS